jgi:hypothetical protein
MNEDLKEILDETVKWLDGNPESDDAFNYLWKIHSVWKKLNAKEEYSVWFNNYHHDGEDRFVKITKSDYDILKKDDFELARGNWTPHVELIYDNDEIEESQVDWNTCIEIAIC